jgi:NifU-like protein involved in Fe-S cluster formation
MAYSEKVLDHYENPRNVGSFAKDADDVGTGMVGAPACGDVMKLQIRVGADGIIEDAKFKTYGCGSAIASSSLVTEWVKGKTLDDPQYADRRGIGAAAREDPLFDPGRGRHQGRCYGLQAEARHGAGERASQCRHRG